MSSQSRITVKVLNHECNHIANPGFQDSRKAFSYLVTQPLIVPKAQIFSFICELLNRRARHRRNSIRILDSGIGPAPFETFLLSHDKMDIPYEINVLGVDLSRDMIGLGQRRLAGIVPAQWVKSASIEMHSGIDCLKFDEALNSLRAAHDSFSLIIHSQFEHYYPNSKCSHLGQELSQAGLPFLTKRQLREFAHNLLEPGGVYVAFDDFETENPTQNAINELCWDISVLRRFCQPAVQQRVGRTIPELGKALKTKYDFRFSVKHLLQAIAKARESRRRLCREEIQRLSVAKRDLEDIFGHENVFIKPHPRRDTHASFHLLYAIKR